MAVLHEEFGVPDDQGMDKLPEDQRGAFIDRLQQLKEEAEE